MPVQLLRPSGADRWAYCPASPDLEEQFPELSDSEKAREGTAAAWYVAEALLGRPPAIGTRASNGHPVDAEMIEGGEVYLEYCRRAMSTASSMALIRVETKITMHGLVHPLNEGTPDFFMVDAAAKRIILPDFKYGHRPVEVFQNMQLVDYAAGACEALELGPLDIHDWDVTLAIIQPRNYRGSGPVQEWHITGAYLFELISWLSGRAYAAMAPGAPCITGEWCNDCSANVNCIAFQATAGDAMEVSRQALAMELSDDALGLLLKLTLRAQRKLKSMASALEELAEVRIKQGRVVPHFAMKSDPGAEKWHDPAAVVALGDALGINLRKPPMTTTVLTPKQARDLPGMLPELVEGFAYRPSTPKLSEINENAAKKAFT